MSMFQIYNFQTMIEKILKSATVDRPSYTIDNAFPFFSTGHFDTEKRLLFIMEFSRKFKQISFDTPEFLLWISN